LLRKSFPEYISRKAGNPGTVARVAVVESRKEPK
jgi:hypothetical protein